MSKSTDSLSKAVGLALAVRLGESLHAIPIAAIEEVLPALPIEPVPHAPPFILGVVFVRGHLIPVVDAGERLGVPRKRPLEPPIVCVYCNQRLFGIEVDEALDLIDLDGAAVLSAEQAGAAAGFFAGVIDYQGEVIRLLDPEQLLGAEEKTQLQAIESHA
ncbi:chemotaxis protein CheW [Lignipirellula cremea]|uniref:Purine-binding chemotaxis protein n=1 Tax=Lignipirellula cremea TaxID=2528010 RepID=A0A518DYV0_9BACT|nr:chemotaxis protein CheW [Lignipirellula cremea]QDU97020.1 purine-binding chemotaxis protein [Lignipirellula cremea]